jgi:hypothetical protein
MFGCSAVGQTRAMQATQYHVRYANGEGEVAESLDAARNVALRRTGDDQAPPDLSPVEIWEVGPNEVGAGKIVEVLDT